MKPDLQARIEELQGENTNILPGMGVGRGNARARRVKRLSYVAIVPWVRVPQLASSILSQIGQRIGQDWQAKSKQPIWLLETFVDPQRFAGACYRAAHWIYLGQTRGRERQGPAGQLSTTIKDVYVCPCTPIAVALLVSKMPAEQAEALSLPITACPLSRCTLAREAQRHEDIALKVRRQLVEAIVRLKFGIGNRVRTRIVAANKFGPGSTDYG